MDKEREYLCKVETKDDDFYLLSRKVCGKENGFDLCITDGLSVWSTRVTRDLLKEMAAKVEMDVKDFTLQTLRALTSQSSGKDCFIYEAVRTDSKLEFNWKKQLDDGVKYQLGSVSLNLNKESKSLMQKILNFAIKRISDYENTTVFMKSETERLGKDRDYATLRLEKCVSAKEEMESDLFQKFVTVLNDKKAKIRRLQEVIEQQSKETSNVSHADGLDNGEKDNLSKQSHKRNDDTDAESDHSQNNDETIEKQNTSNSSNIGSCLFKDEEDTGPVVKRRRKKQGSKPIATPSKSVLPEVKTTVKRTVSNASSSSAASNESGPSSSRRSRRNKTPSTFPDDVEELFGDMA